jgi:two-component system OmpR family response regulator
VPRKILIVDDNQELLNLLARLMEAEGWTPVAVGKGRQALDRIASERPAAAVVDVLLPDMMGYDVGQALKAAGIPYVFMTGVFKGGRAASDARSQYGASGYFEKPFEARKLVDALHELLPTTTPVPGGLDEPTAEATGDFDVEVAVEADEPVQGLDLTGKVTVTEDGKISAILSGDTVKVSPVPMTARSPGPPPLPPVPAAKTPSAVATRVRPELAPVQGRLEDNLPELITAFHLAQQTGELTLQRNKVKKTIYFDKGRPCFAISNLVSDRFGPFLVRVGKITASQLELVQAAADKTGRRSGDVLVEMGLLKDTEKLYYVAQQVKAIVYSSFGWEQGEFRIHFADRASQEAIKVDLHPANLIVRGIKKLYKPERLYRLLRPEDRLIPSQQPAYGLYEVELERWEAELLPKVDGTRTVAELLHIARKPDHVLYGFLVGMWALKILDRRDQ